MTEVSEVAQESRSPVAGRRSPRERLLAAADELFYSEGVHVVGVDRILERAGVAKASMYHAFGSKEALVAAYLDARNLRILARIDEAVQRETDPRLRLLAVFDVQSRWLADPAYRGCAFARASAEAPADGRVQRATDDYRTAVRDLLTRLAAKAGVPAAAALGLQLYVLYNGAAVLTGPASGPVVGTAIRSAAEALLDAALARGVAERSAG